MKRLEVKGVEVRYGDLVAVRSASFDVTSGQMLAVTGPSGAGKSSLLWALAGALVPSAGEVRVEGELVTDRDRSAALGVTFVPQGNALASSLTALENILVPLVTREVPAAAAMERSLAALAEVGLEDSRDHLVEELSGGQQQRVAVARSLAAGARVVLADEPTSDLDAGNRERIVGSLRELAEQGAAVVMSTHDPEAAAAADGEISLDAGVLTWMRSLTHSHRAEVSEVR